MKFGEKVRDLRKKHSLTQDELAQCLGINKRTIIGWERDGCEDYISAESLVECIHGLPVKSIEFFTAENQRKEA